MKVTLRMRSSSMTASEIGCGTPVSRLSTPAGTPASRKQSINSLTAPVPSSAGRVTIEQPAASAGAILRACSTIGKFQAVKAATGPTGS